MKKNDNIEKLFNETFKNFEADVDPRIWNNIENGLSSSAGSTASSAAKFAVGKIIAGVASIAVISASIWYLASPEKSEKQLPSTQSSVNENIVKEPVSTNEVEEQQSQSESASDKTEHTNWQAPPAVRTLNQYPTENYKQTPSVTKESDQVVSSDESTLDNASANSGKPAGKYGNATQGDGGMIRGTNAAVSSSSSSGQLADVQEENPEAPAAVIFVNTSSGDAPLTVDFISQGESSSLVWDFGDGSISRESSPSHTFERPGNYTVKLTAKNAKGTASDKVNIEVKSVSSITNIPNIFTPNGDGENDFFFFEMKNIASIGVAIYSQKEGRQIYTWNTIDGKWDGKLMNGQNAPEGVYLYSIQANGTDGIVHSKKGVITLSIKR